MRSVVTSWFDGMSTFEAPLLRCHSGSALASSTDVHAHSHELPSLHRSVLVTYFQFPYSDALIVGFLSDSSVIIGTQWFAIFLFP